MPIFCAYGQMKEHGAGPQGNGCITGHHIIPDHCFYYTSGKGKESCPVIAGYNIQLAPVVLVTADKNGGKSRQHGSVHSFFDPVELAAQLVAGNEWTYLHARTAAIASLKKALGADEGKVREVLDNYFIIGLGLTESSLMRAGEHGTMKHAPNPRASKRRKK